MRLLIPYNQGLKVINPARQHGFNMRTFGVCFRVTCKWAFCKLMGSSMKFDGGNFMKITEKHHMYRYETLQFAAANPNWRTTRMGAYLDIDYTETRRYVDLWSISFKDAAGFRYDNEIRIRCQTRSLVEAYQEYDPHTWRNAALVVYYSVGTSGALAGGHVVAICYDKFFDSNSGEWEINPDNYAQELATYISTSALSHGEHVHRWNIIILETA